MLMVEYYRRITRGVSVTEQIKKAPQFIINQLKVVTIEIIYLIYFRLNSMKKVVNKDELQIQLSETNSILFLCTGNICRSPFAEHILRDTYQLDGMKIASAGLKTSEGRPSPKHAKDVAEDYGVDLSDHKSKDICKGMIKSYDVIFIMDYYNYYLYQKKFSEFKSCAFLLGIADNNNTNQIDDPYGGGEEVFNATFSNIEESIQQIMKYIPEDKVDN